MFASSFNLIDSVHIDQMADDRFTEGKYTILKIESVHSYLTIYHCIDWNSELYELWIDTNRKIGQLKNISNGSVLLFYN